jgi:hypothetical protein
MTIAILIQNRKYFAGIDRPFYVSQAVVKDRLEEKGFRSIKFHDRDEEPLPSNVNPKACHIWTDDWDEWISCEYYGPSGETELPATPAWILHGIEDIGAPPAVVPDANDQEDIAEPGENIMKAGGIVLAIIATLFLFGRRR